VIFPRVRREGTRPIAALLAALLLVGGLTNMSCGSELTKEDPDYATFAEGFFISMIVAFAVTAAKLAEPRPAPAILGPEVAQPIAAESAGADTLRRPRRALGGRRVTIPTRPPMGVTEALSSVFRALRPRTGASYLSIRTLKDVFGGSIFETALDGLVAKYPHILTRIPGGVRFDYGPCMVDPAGNMFSGRIEVACPDVAASPTSISATCNVAFDNYTENGAATQVDWLTWNIDLALGPEDRAAGDVTLTGGSGLPTAVPDPGSQSAAAHLSPGVSVTGSVHFDTDVCPTYPISGSIRVTIDGKTTTVTFTDACDGTYLLDLPNARYWALVVSLYACDNFLYRTEIDFVEDSGVLTVDRGIPPKYQNNTGAGRWNAGGWINDSEVHIEFSKPGIAAAPDLLEGVSVSGTFHGQRLGTSNFYKGELTYTLAEELPAVEEPCSVTRARVVNNLDQVYLCFGHCRTP
jgi:hypothetical protein